MNLNGTPQLTGGGNGGGNNGNGSNGNGGPAGLPKLREILRRQKQVGSREEGRVFLTFFLNYFICRIQTIFLNSNLTLLLYLLGSWLWRRDGLTWRGVCVLGLRLAGRRAGRVLLLHWEPRVSLCAKVRATFNQWLKEQVWLHFHFCTGNSKILRNQCQIWSNEVDLQLFCCLC